MVSIVQKRKWVPVVPAIALIGLVILGVRLSTLDGVHATNRGFSRVDSLECSRPQSMPDGIAVYEMQETHIPSVRNIIDPTAPNYAVPTNSRYGVLGAFPGDTTFVVEQGQYLVATRLIGQTGDTLRVQWGNQTFPIIAVYGGGVGWKQRYITVHGGKHYMLPIQWNEQASTWEPYNLDRWFAGTGPSVPRAEDSLEGRCSDCHTVADMSRSGMVFAGSE
ncbi:MAG TPA: hypothetical protein ENN56_00710 [Firmicutes bacterium]|nr:hypothetical protein [Bacillota bacterium]